MSTYSSIRWIIKGYCCRFTSCVSGQPNSCPHCDECKGIQIAEESNGITLENLLSCRAFAGLRRALSLKNLRGVAHVPRESIQSLETIIPEDAENGLDRIVLSDDGLTLSIQIKYPCDLCANSANCQNSVKDFATNLFDSRNMYEPLLESQCLKTPAFFVFARATNCSAY